MIQCISCFVLCFLVVKVVLLLYSYGVMISRVIFCEAAYMFFQLNVPVIIMLCI